MTWTTVLVVAAYVAVTVLAVVLAWRLDWRVDRWLLWSEARRTLRAAAQPDGDTTGR